MPRIAIVKLPEYVTKEEVRRVCKKLKLRDWTKIKAPKISLKEAKIVLKQIDSAGLKIDPEQFRSCLLYTSDAADEEDSVDLGGRRIIKKKKKRSEDKE